MGFFSKKKYDPYPVELKNAVFLGQTELVEVLLKEVGNVNKRFENSSFFIYASGRASSMFEVTKGVSLLMYASWLGRAGVAKLLIDAGADLYAKSDGDHTALEAALKKGHVNVVRVLLDAGISATKGDGIVKTPITRANDIEMAELFLSRGADVNAKSNYGYTALYTEAERYKARNYVKYLLEKGADVNVKSDNSTTPLIYASSRFEVNVDVVEILLDNGARVNTRDKNGWTALRHAFSRGANEAAHILKQYGAKC